MELGTITCTLFSLLLMLTVLTRDSYTAVVGECSKKRQSNRCTGANAFWQYDGICIDESDDTRLPTCHVPETREFSFKLIASIVQLNVTGALPVHRLWIRGAGPGLSWERSTEMTRVKDGYWMLPIKYVYDSNALLCLKESRCTLNQRALEFRVYRDVHGVDEMLGPNIYVPLPVSNSISGHHEFSPPYVLTHPWFDNKRVLAVNYAFKDILNFEPHFSRYVNFTAFYPPSYEHNTMKRYPVVITFGSNLKNLLIPLLESMYAHESSIEEAFIFALHNPNGPPLCEYNPFVVLSYNAFKYGGNYRYDCYDRGDDDCLQCKFDFNEECIRCLKKDEKCIECMNCLNDQRAELCDAKEFAEQAKLCGFRSIGCNARGDAILDNIENILLPEMSFRTAGRIKIDYPKDRISIIGIDGAGLLACFAALSRPLVYKNAGCLSAPFHWPIRTLILKESREKQGIGLLFEELADKMTVSPELQLLYATQTYYIDVGEFDNDYMPIVNEHNYSDWVVDQMIARLHMDPSNILYYKNVLGGHNSAFFLHRDGDNRMLDRLRLPLSVFLKPQGGLNAFHPRTPIVLKEDYVRRNDDLENAKVPESIVSMSDKVSERSCRDLLPVESKTVSVNIYLISIGKFNPFSVLRGSQSSHNDIMLFRRGAISKWLTQWAEIISSLFHNSMVTADMHTFSAIVSAIDLQ